MLFNLVMDRIINQVKGVGRGYRMGQTKFKILCDADDAVLIAKSEDNLQQMLFEFNQTANKYNMSISIPKTKCGVTLRDRHKSNEIREQCDGMPDVVRWSPGRRRE